MEKIVKINVFVSTNRQGSDVKDTIDVHIDDTWTSEQIEEEKERVTREWMYENIDWGWND